MARYDPQSNPDVYRGTNDPDKVIRAVLGPRGLEQLEGAVDSLPDGASVASALGSEGLEAVGYALDSLLNRAQAPQRVLPGPSEPGIALGKIRRDHYNGARVF